ncbi:MAG: ABC transporter ATP-binding protein, partial [Micrococcales bacterium]|nr:ABC transporter ATP-binding protein [Micrococcales bacterium]
MNGAVRVLAVRDLQVRFGSEVGVVHAVRGVDLTLAAGRTLGLVGESGSGKSAIGLAIMGLLPAHARTQGSVRLAGTELLGLDDVAMSRHRGVDLGMVFQDPAGALTPVLTVGAQVEEALRIHGVSRRAAAERALALLELVGLLDPRRAALAYPHEISGGQRQRVAIAIAVANEPAVVIADEPTTALDTCVQAQVLSVLRHTTRELGAALLLITHDLAVVAGLADDVAVIRAGRIVELAPAQQLYAAPAHPYTRRLLRATPRIDSPPAPRTLGPPTPRRPLDDT